MNHKNSPNSGNIEDILKDLLYEQSAREHLKSLKKQPRFIKKLLPYAAAVLLLVSAGIYWLSMGNQNSLYQEYYAFPDINRSRGQDLTDQQLTVLESGEYEKALSFFNTHPYTSPRDYYMHAHLYLINAEYSNATSLLKGPDWPASYTTERAWLLFLLELRNAPQNMDQLKEYQKDMSEQDKEKANAILKELEED
ncbi:MAG TPA: hypothetical protein VJ917_07275 [Saprospiraceae bacterium]|nr:hypothetical protein [Saprospiraceae bacterium]